MQKQNRIHILVAYNRGLNKMLNKLTENKEVISLWFSSIDKSFPLALPMNLLSKEMNISYV